MVARSARPCERRAAAQPPAAPPRRLLRHRGGLVVLPETEFVAMRVTAHREPAHAGHRHAIGRLAAKLLDAGDPGVDVVDVEVRPGPALLGLHVGDGGAGALAGASHVVFRRPRVGLELPAEEAAPELAALDGVVGGDLEMHDLAGHASSWSVERSVSTP